MKLYNPAEAARLVGISGSTLRNYGKLYSDNLSSYAVPGHGIARQFTADDLKLLHFVYETTRRGVPHDDVKAKIAAGALDEYTGFTEPGSVEVEPMNAPFDTPSAAPGALVLLERFTALQDEINGLQHELGKAEGKAETLERENERLNAQLERLTARQLRPWWRKLLGME